MKEDLLAAVKAMRTGEIARGNDALVRFVDGFSGLIAKLATTEGDRRALVAILGALTAAQARGDFNYVADVLEQHLLPLF